MRIGIRWQQGMFQSIPRRIGRLPHKRRVFVRFGTPSVTAPYSDPRGAQSALPTWAAFSLQASLIQRPRRDPTARTNFKQTFCKPPSSWPRTLLYYPPKNLVLFQKPRNPRRIIKCKLRLPLQFPSGTLYCGFDFLERLLSALALTATTHP